MSAKPCDGCDRWCVRHALYKSEKEVEVCQRDEKVRAYLDSTAEERASVLIGNKLAAIFRSVGLTKERWAMVKNHMGLPAECDCEARQNYMNQLHAMVRGSK